MDIGFFTIQLFYGIKKAVFAHATIYFSTLPTSKIRKTPLHTSQSEITNVKYMYPPKKFLKKNKQQDTLKHRTFRKSNNFGPNA